MLKNAPKKTLGPAAGRLIAVGLFAFTMAYCEAAVVAYLREIYGIEDLVRDIPRVIDSITRIEIGREAATLLMLASVGWVAGWSWRGRLGYFVFAFGLWDIFYYGWLVVLLGWPTSLLDWDLLFLIPLPWWGPVLAPMLIAMLMAIAGAVCVHLEALNKVPRLRTVDWIVLIAGMFLALAVFMADALRALPGGLQAMQKVQPTCFPWPIFILALAGMAFFTARLAASGRRHP